MKWMHRFLLALKKRELERTRNQFIESTRRARKIQNELMLKKLQANRDTEYGRLHSFYRLNTIDEFRRTVPLNDYDDLYPSIKRIIKGERNILFNTRENLLMFALTSGTTGIPKYIPVTQSFLDEYRQASKLWNLFVFKDHPAVIDHRFLPLVSPSFEFYERGIPCGSISGLVSEAQGYLVRSMYALPMRVYTIGNLEVRYYVIMRLAIATQISFLSAANPSTLIKLARVGDSCRGELIRDIADGTLRVRDELDNDLYRSISCYLKRDKKRACQLERIIGETGHLYPKDYWNSLALIASWKGGPLFHYINLFHDYYGDLPVRDLGLLASEGRITIPLHDNGSAGVLDITGHFYEFIPEADVDEEQPQTLLGDELEVGRAYFLVLTTSSGLYRYKMHDLIRVDGYLNEAPIISFQNKGKHICSMTGEKISEYQSVTAVQEAIGYYGYALEIFMVCPCWAEIPHYTLIVEEKDFSRIGSWSLILASVDDSLRRLNYEYNTKRGSGRLGRLTLVVVANGSFETMRDLRIESRRGRQEQYKHPYLVPEIDFHKKLKVIPVSEDIPSSPPKRNNYSVPSGCGN